jgi:hypothetical protein
LVKSSPGKDVITSPELVVLNLGLETFKTALDQQKVVCLQVALQPRPKLQKKLQDALDKLL